MKKVSVFKTICWFVLACALFGILNEIAYNLFFSFLGFLSENIKLVRSFISYSFLFQMLVFFASSMYGSLCSFITFLILPKKSINAGKALFGCGIAWIVYGLYALVSFAIDGNFILIVSEIVGGYYLIQYGKTIESGYFDSIEH